MTESGNVPSTARNALVMVRVRADERETLRLAAERKGIPLSAYLRDRALREARRENDRAARKAA